MPSTFGTLYSRCSICHIKPATLQCTPCDALLCFQCDQSQHQQIKHQRKLIQYEDHNKENHYHQNKEDSYSSFNLQENTDHMDLKYRIKLQEQENSINILKAHIDTLSQAFEQHLQQLREEKLSLEEQLSHHKGHKDVELQKLSLMYECKLEQAKVNLESERENSSLLGFQVEAQKCKQLDLSEVYRKEINQIKCQMEAIAEENEEKAQDWQKELLDTKIQTQNELQECVKQHRVQQQLLQDKYEAQLASKVENIKAMNQQVIQLQQSLHLSNQSYRSLEENLEIKMEQRDAQLAELGIVNTNLQSEIRLHQAALSLQANEIIQLQQQIMGNEDLQQKQKRRIQKYEKILYNGKVKQL